MCVAVGNAYAYSVNRLIELVEDSERYSGSDDSDSESKSFSSIPFSFPSTSSADSTDSSTHAVNKFRFSIHNLRACLTKLSNSTSNSMRRSREVRCCFCNRQAKRGTRRAVPGSKAIIHTNCYLDQLRLHTLNQSRSKFVLLRQQLEARYTLQHTAATIASEYKEDQKHELTVVQAANTAEKLMKMLPIRMQDEAIQSTTLSDAFAADSASSAGIIQFARPIGEHFNSITELFPLDLHSPISFDSKLHHTNCQCAVLSHDMLST